MKRNILISDPAVPTFRYTFVLDLISICVLLFLALQAGFILKRKNPSYIDLLIGKLQVKSRGATCLMLFWIRATSLA